MDEAILKIITVGQGAAVAGSAAGGAQSMPPAGTPSTPQAPPSTIGMLGQIAGKVGGVPGAAGQVVSAAGGLGTAAGAAAPVAGAVGLVLALKLLTDQTIQAYNAVGTFSASLLSASNDPGQIVGQLGTAISGLSNQIFFINPILGAFGKSLGATVTILSEFMAAFDGMVQRYAQYSPGIAIAQAQAEVTQILGDLRRAREGTPALVEYIRARTELQQKFEDAKIRFMERMAPLIVAGMEAIGNAIPILERILESGLELVRLNPQLADKVDEIRRRMAENQMNQEMTNMTLEILNRQVNQPRFPFELNPEGPGSPLVP